MLQAALHGGVPALAAGGAAALAPYVPAAWGGGPWTGIPATVAELGLGGLAYFGANKAADALDPSGAEASQEHGFANVAGQIAGGAAGFKYGKGARPSPAATSTVGTPTTPGSTYWGEYGNGPITDKSRLLQERNPIAMPDAPTTPVAAGGDASSVPTPTTPPTGTGEVKAEKVAPKVTKGKKPAATKAPLGDFHNDAKIKQALDVFMKQQGMAAGAPPGAVEAVTKQLGEAGFTPKMIADFTPEQVQLELAKLMSQ